MRPTRMVLVCCLFASAGCGTAPRPADARNAPVGDKLVAVAKGYNEATAGLGRPPKTVDELRPYLNRFGPPDEVLRSPTDDQPFVIGFKAAAPGDVVACEQTGSGGRRAAVNLRGEVSSISDAEFARMQTATAGPKPKMDPPDGGHKQGPLSGIIGQAGKANKP